MPTTKKYIDSKGIVLTDASTSVTHDVPSQQQRATVDSPVAAGTSDLDLLRQMIAQMQGLLVQRIDAIDSRLGGVDDKVDRVASALPPDLAGSLANLTSRVEALESEGQRRRALRQLEPVRFDGPRAPGPGIAQAGTSSIRGPAFRYAPQSLHDERDDD